VTLGGTSLLWNVYLYKLDRPGFIIDCARDFDPPGFGTMGRGAPSGAYYVYDNRTNEVTIPCKIINVGQKTEVVRRIESTLKVLDINAPSAPIDAMTISGKAFQDVAFTYHFPWASYNGATLNVSVVTPSGKLSLEKSIVMYPFY
jgi:hypothetical protein